MPRISIIIPAVSTVEALESTLVSVLQNRPSDAEIIVVLGHKYADPYSLSDEVQFISAPAKAQPIKAANLGIENAHAPIVHILTAGCEVQDGWCESALRQFANPKVAAVAPTLYDRLGQESPLAHGVALSWTGARKILLAKRDEKFPKLIHAPLTYAGFYRRETLQMLGGFDPRAGHCADVLLGQLFQSLGARVYADAQSIVYAPHALVYPSASFRSGLYEQQATLGLAGELGWSAKFAQPFQLLGALLQSLRGLAGVKDFLGRVAGTCNWPAHAGIRSRIAKLIASSQHMIEDGPTLLRVDPAHASAKKVETPSPARKVG